MQPITILGMALCLGLLAYRASKARKKPRSSSKRRFKTAHVLIAVLFVWLLVSLRLDHLNRAMSSDAPVPHSAWERIIQTLSDWI
jgi:hypothetical protein